MKSILKFQLLYILSLFCLIANNANGQDFEIAPVMLSFNADPGENQAKVITVKNHSNNKASFIVALADFLPSIDGEKKTLPPNSTKRSCANWMNINPSFFELNPSEEIQVQVNMLVPNDEYGTKWCILYIQPTTEQTSWTADKTLGAGVNVSSRIAVRIYQSPKSNTNHSLKIGNLTENTPVGSKKRTFTATIENLGDNITKCKVYLVASNMKTAEEKQFDPIEVETFPKMSRTVDLIIPEELPVGTYSLAAIVDYGSKNALEGTQILIEYEDFSGSVKPDTTIIKSDAINER